LGYGAMLEQAFLCSFMCLVNDAIITRYKKRKKYLNAADQPIF